MPIHTIYFPHADHTIRVSSRQMNTILDRFGPYIKPAGEKVWMVGQTAHVPKFHVGQKVIDTDGRYGVIREVMGWTVHGGQTIGYEVAFERGTAVRWENELKPVTPTSDRPGDMAYEYAEETGCSYSEALVRCNMD